MVDLHAARGDVCADAFELGMGRIKGLEGVPKAIKFCIRDFGLGEVVIQVGMVGYGLR
jgi:hypothetical protein